MQTALRVECSGFGHYGVCTVLPRELLLLSIKKLEESREKGRWPDLLDYPQWPIGVEGALREVSDPGDNTAKLVWDPRKMEESMLTHAILMRCSTLFPEFNYSIAKEGMSLELGCGPCENSWFVHANFSDEVWRFIEGPKFEVLLNPINTDICFWWEDQYGTRQLGQYVTVFDGKNGRTLQVYQGSGGGGLWVSGCGRVDNPCGYQITDHNTDTYYQAFSHIISLCLVLKHCRVASET